MFYCLRPLWRLLAVAVGTLSLFALMFAMQRPEDICKPADPSPIMHIKERVIVTDEYFRYLADTPAWLGRTEHKMNNTAVDAYLEIVKQLFNYTDTRGRTWRRAAVLYVPGRSDILAPWVNVVLPAIRNPFVLVTGGSDSSICYGEDCGKILKSPLLVKWFARNGIQGKTKLEAVPIGISTHRAFNMFWFLGIRGLQDIPVLDPRQWFPSCVIDAEAELLSLRASSLPLSERLPLAHADFQFNTNHKNAEHRLKAIEKLKNNSNVHFARVRTKPWYNWRDITKYAFVISPWGVGPDCFRTWEALVLGAIVLNVRPCFKRTTPFERLFEGLPVVFLDSWHDVSSENLRKWQAYYSKQKIFDPSAVLHPKLTRKYWRHVILNASLAAFSVDGMSADERLLTE